MVDKFDGELTVGSIVGVKKISDFTTSRMDHSVRKRVELHCHTKNERYGRRIRGKGYCQEGVSVGDIRRSQSRITASYSHFRMQTICWMTSGKRRKKSVRLQETKIRTEMISLK